MTMLSVARWRRLPGRTQYGRQRLIVRAEDDGVVEECDRQLVGPGQLAQRGQRLLPRLSRNAIERDQLDLNAGILLLEIVDHAPAYRAPGAGVNDGFHLAAIL